MPDIASVIPAKAGIQDYCWSPLDSGLRRNDAQDTRSRCTDPFGWGCVLLPC